MTTSRKPTSAEKIHKAITDKIKSGTMPWDRPWNTSTARLGENKNFTTDKPYRGINAFMTYGIFESPNWMTFKQINDKGGKVRKGSSATLVIFWSMIKNKKEESKDKEDKMFPIMKFYYIFNLDQVEGIDCPDTKDTEDKLDFVPSEKAESVVKKYKNIPTINHGGPVACYNFIKDVVSVPAKDDFKSVEGYYATLFHELVHSTGHTSRLNRNLTGMGDHSSYSKEELVAEMGAAILCSQSGLSEEVIDNQASYISSWSSRLKDAPGELINACQKAQKAVDLINGISYESDKAKSKK